MSRVAVVTGASAGWAGRSRRSWPAAATPSPSSRAGRPGLTGRCRCGAQPRRDGPAHPDRRQRRRSRRRRCRAGRAGAGRDRPVGQRRLAVRVRLVLGRRARGVRARDRGHLSRLRLRHPRRAGPDAAARPGDGRAGRVGAGLPRHPAAGALLRGQARDPGLPRLAAGRAVRRRQQRAGHDGADAGAEHAAVRVGAVPAAAQGAAGRADLPARGRRSCGRVGGRPPAAPGVLGRREHGRDPAGQRRRTRRARPLPRAHRRRRRSRRRSRRTRSRSDYLFRPVDDTDDHGAHGRFDSDGQVRPARRRRWRSTTALWRLRAVSRSRPGWPRCARRRRR